MVWAFEIVFLKYAKTFSLTYSCSRKFKNFTVIELLLRLNLCVLNSSISIDVVVLKQQFSLPLHVQSFAEAYRIAI